MTDKVYFHNACDIKIKIVKGNIPIPTTVTHAQCTGCNICHASAYLKHINYCPNCGKEVIEVTKKYRG